MVYGNITVMLTVVAVVLCVLAIVGGAVYCLNRAVDQNGS